MYHIKQPTTQIHFKGISFVTNQTHLHLASVNANNPHPPVRNDLFAAATTNKITPPLPSHIPTSPHTFPPFPHTLPPPLTHSHLPSHIPTSPHTLPPLLTLPPPSLPPPLIHSHLPIYSYLPSHFHLPSHTPTSPHTLPPPLTHSHLPSHTPTSPHTLPPPLTHSHFPSHTPTSPYTPTIYISLTTHKHSNALTIHATHINGEGVGCKWRGCKV